MAKYPGCYSGRKEETDVSSLLRRLPENDNISTPLRQIRIEEHFGKKSPQGSQDFSLEVGKLRKPERHK